MHALHCPPRPLYHRPQSLVRTWWFSFSNLVGKREESSLSSLLPASIIDTLRRISPEIHSPPFPPASPRSHPHIRRGFQWILKITLQTIRHRSFRSSILPWFLLLAFRYYSLSRPASSQPLPVATFRLQRWKFHSKRTPLCKYLRESLLMLSWGGQRVVRHTGWSRGGAWLMGPSDVTKPKERVSRICAKSIASCAV